MIKTLPTGNSDWHLVKGFTLIEILVVLTIISILASSVSYLLFNRQDTFKSVALDIVQKLRVMRQQAIRDDRPYQLEIDLERNSLRFIDDLVELPEDVSITVRTAENQVIDNHVAGMTFYPDASSSGGVITFENDGEVFQISVIWISGKILIRHQSRSS